MQGIEQPSPSFTPGKCFSVLLFVLTIGACANRSYKETNAKFLDDMTQSECPTLPERLNFFNVEIEKPIVVSSVSGKQSDYVNDYLDWYGRAQVYPMNVRFTEDGRLFVGYHILNGNSVTQEIAQVNLENNSIMSKISIPGLGIRDFLVDGDAVVALYLLKYQVNSSQRYATRMRIRKQKISGEVVFDKDLSNFTSKPLHRGKVVKRNSTYAAYFGIEKYFPKLREYHQGNYLAEISHDGTNLQKSYDWICSHSIDQDILQFEKEMLPICVSDYYTEGLNIQTNGRRVNLIPDRKQYNGFGAMTYGSSVKLDNVAYVIFNSSYGRLKGGSNRASFWGLRDIALTSIDLSKPSRSSGKKWLTNTKASDYGERVSIIDQDKLLVTYFTRGNMNMQAQIFSVSHTQANQLELIPTSKKYELPILMDQIQIPAVSPNGDVFFAGYLNQDGPKIQLAKIATCK